jgi:hypothetical protein
MTENLDQLSAELTEAGLPHVAAVIDQARASLTSLLAICGSIDLTPEQRDAVSAAERLVAAH